MEKVQVQVVKEDNQSVIDNALELINRRMDELEDVMDEWDQLTKMSELMDRMSVNDREEMRNV
jgi:DNA-directed RNA polymerase subunit L